MLNKYGVVGAVVIALCAGASFYWSALVGRAVEVPLALAFELREAGYDAWVGEAAGGGFPSRVEVVAQSPRIATGDRSWTWSAPSLTATSVIYRLDHLLVSWPESQRVEAPFGDFDVASSGMRMSLVFADAPAGGAGEPLERLSWEATDLVVDGPRIAVAIDRVEAHLRRAVGDPTVSGRYRIYVKAEGARLQRADAKTPPPPQVERIAFDGDLVFEQRPTRNPAAIASPIALRIGAGGLSWANAGAQISGEIALAETPISATLAVDAAGASGIIARLEALGWLSRAAAASLIARVDAEGGLQGEWTLKDQVAEFDGVALFALE